MTPVAVRSIYDEAAIGSPVGFFPQRQFLDTSQDFLWIVGEWGLKFPPMVPQPASETQQQAIQIRKWTGWSIRFLADVVGTSHTTIRGIENGRPVADSRSGNLRTRITNVHDVVQRVHLLAGRDPWKVARALSTEPMSGASAVEEMKHCQFGAAYVAAIDALRPRPTAPLVGGRPRQGDATFALHD